MTYIYRILYSSEKCYSTVVRSQVVISALNWRWLLVLTSIPCFLLLPFFRIIPESPRYLCAQNRMSDATLVLESVSMINQEALPPGVLTYRRESKVDTLTSETEIDRSLLSFFLTKMASHLTQNFIFFLVCICRFLMVNHTTGNVMFTVLAFACGKSIAVTCHTQT